MMKRFLLALRPACRTTKGEYMNQSVFKSFLIVGFLFASSAHADAPPEDGNPAFEAALESCASTVSKESNGRPDQTAMTTCLTAKGFAKPSGGNPPPPPPRCKLPG